MDTRGWPVSVPIGRRLNGWEIVEPLGTGSWGSVYAGRRAGRTAALKLLPTGNLTPRQFRQLAAMSVRELRSHGELARHPHLVSVLDTFVVDDPGHPELDGVTVIVMEMARRSLAEATRPGHPVPEAPRIISEICAGLAHMHAHGWLHCDLKPSNILLMADGSVRLADFGLTTELDGSHAYLPRIGSMDYLAPERRSEPMTVEGAAVRASADIWALGVVAHQLLAGRFPFPGGTWRARAAAAVEYVEGRAPLLLDPRLPPGWRDWIGDCLAPTHQARSRHDAASLLHRARRLAGTDRRYHWSGRRILVTLAAAFSALVAGGSAVAAPAGTPVDPTAPWLRTGSDIPREYRGTIVAAAISHCDDDLVTAPLIAAMLKAESGFDAGLADPARDEYGIARWTPSVMKYFLPPERYGQTPTPPLDPYESIHSVGRYLCQKAQAIARLPIPGDDRLLVAAAYRSSVDSVAKAGGVPAKWRTHIARLGTYLRDYEPRARDAP